jgi:hypothetical protein
VRCESLNYDCDGLDGARNKATAIFGPIRLNPPNETGDMATKGPWMAGGYVPGAHWEVIGKGQGGENAKLLSLLSLLFR